MKIVMAMYYYHPYISGLSVYARRTAAELVRRGHEVVMVTSHFDKGLERRETVDGVHIRRVPIWFRMDKGAIMGSFVPTILHEARDADVINLHLPMAEASAVAFWAPRKTVITYHCDVRLNARHPLGRLVEKGIFRSTRLALKWSRAAVSQTFDYAANTKVLRHYLDKTVIIPPPIPTLDATGPATIAPEYFRDRAHVPAGAKSVGFVGRIVYEKGIDFLIHAFQDLQKRHDDLYLLIAGDYQHVVGGSVKSSLMRYLSGRDERVRFLGRVSDAELDAFYRFIDVLALPSIDPLEAYGMVQVEAMVRGTPVVATDLPGVRTIVQRTGMGQVVAKRDPHALGVVLERVLYENAWQSRAPAEVFRLLDLEDTTAEYEALFRKVANGEAV